jgi:hypothetical protein
MQYYHTCPHFVQEIALDMEFASGISVVAETYAIVSMVGLVRIAQLWIWDAQFMAAPAMVHMTQLLVCANVIQAFGARIAQVG